jgi:formylmethanofuran dehydrogenase subunit E
MSYPKFYDTIETIKLKDPLADLLGTFENGEYEISYQEVVKGAGHSCPTVAGAYLMALMALKELYPSSRAIRGDIKVYFNEDITEGVAGVIANVISYITGATDKSGFKGLGGKFARHDLMFFNEDINGASARFSSISSGKSVDVIYDHSQIPMNPQMKELMQKLMQGVASEEEKELFGSLWQERVENIFKNIDKVIEVR